MQSLERNPYNTHAWNNLGVLLTATHASLDEIKEALETALLFDPCNTAAMMNLVGPLVEAGEYGQAVALTARALEAQPEKPLVLTKAQVLLKECMEAQDLSASETLLLSWTKARPSDSDAWHNRGLVAHSSGDHDRAVACFSKVLEIIPDDTFALTQLAKLFFQLEKHRECIECCSDLIDRGHEVLLAVGLKARALAFAGSYERALVFLRPYMKHNPESDALLVIVAEIHEYSGHTAAAVEVLRDARRLLERRDDPDALENLHFIDGRLHELGDSAHE